MLCFLLPGRDGTIFIGYQQSPSWVHLYMHKKILDSCLEKTFCLLAVVDCETYKNKTRHFTGKRRQQEWIMCATQGGDHLPSNMFVLFFWGAKHL